MPTRTVLAREIGLGVVTVAFEVAFGWFVLEHQLADIVMVFLLGVVVLAVRFGYAASLTATVLSVLAVDFFFTTPYLSFGVDDPRRILTFAIMGLVALVVSSQTARIRREASTRVALALERARLAEEAHAAHVDAEQERLRNALLSSVSHDLRTPLANIQGAATALLDERSEPSRGAWREHVETIASEAGRLRRLVQNLVDMTSVESGTLRVRKEWNSLEEVVGVALRRLDDQLGRRPVRVRIAADAAFAAFDATLIEQVLVNLIENALKYAPGATPIEIAADRTAEGVIVEVADSGPGIAEGKSEAIFGKFYRASARGVGMGLGLTICRGMVAAHDGRIWAANRRGGGASLRFLLPGPPVPVITKSLPEVV